MEAELLRRDTLKAALNQSHLQWQKTVTTRLGQINSALVLVGQPGNHVDLAIAIQAYRNSLDSSADPNLTSLLLEPVFTYVEPDEIALIRDYALISVSLGICELAASMI